MENVSKAAVALDEVRGVRVWAYVAGSLSLALGIVHDAMLPTQMDGIQSLSADYHDGFVWLFLCTGTAVALAGVLCLLTAGGLARGERVAQRVTLAACVFLGLAGVAGLALDQLGAASLIVLAALMLVPWWKSRRIATGAAG